MSNLVPQTLVCAFSCALLTAVTLQAAPHPSLFLNAQTLDRLRQDPTTWQSIKRQADTILTTHPPTYLATPDLSGDQQNWEMPTGANMPYLALTYALTKEPKYLTASKEWALASCNYPTWGLNKYDGGDLAAGYQLLGLAVIYDWLHDDLDTATRDTIRQTLIRRSRQMLKQSDTFYWRETYLQNHMWVSLTGLAASAFALDDDPEIAAETKTWTAACLKKFRRTNELLGPDGASHEGVTYWSLGIDALLKFWDMAGDFLNEKPSGDWWKNTGYYRQYMALPKNSWTAANNVVDFADCIRTEWVGPDYILHRLAAINHDGHIENLARETTAISTCGLFAACWLGPLWIDPALKPLPESSLPTLRNFSDMGIVSARSDWSGNESLVAFKCGPALGRQATLALDYDAGSAHVHPDANHFVLFGKGEWLIRDDGYRVKGTTDHNTLLIDGKGQIGEFAQSVDNRRRPSVGNWFNAIDQVREKLNPHIVSATSNPMFDYIAGDATEAYPKSSELRRFVRQIVFLKPDVLIVADDIETNEPRDLELRFHPQFSAVESQGAFVSKGEKSILRIEPFKSEGVKIVAGDTPAMELLPPARQRGLDKLEDTTKLYAIRIQNHTAKWRSAVALSWSAAGQDPPHVTVEKEGDTWTFKTGPRKASIQWR